jgi:membrane protein
MSTFSSTYGAAGSLVVVLFWVYYSAQIMFFGAELTKVYANRFGSHIRPDENALPLTQEAREQQGIPADRPSAPAEPGKRPKGSGQQPPSGPPTFFG